MTQKLKLSLAHLREAEELENTSSFAEAESQARMLETAKRKKKATEEPTTAWSEEFAEEESFLSDEEVEGLEEKAYSRGGSEEDRLISASIARFFSKIKGF